MANIQDRIAHTCLECYKQLPKSGKAGLNEWEILSAFILEFNDEFKVISIATGSKCIGQNSMSKKGDVINDSHAEILARRVFNKIN